MTETVTRSEDRGQTALGWSFSLLVHGLMVATAIVLSGRGPLQPPANPFRWNVALVQPSAEATPTPDQQHHRAKLASPTHATPATHLATETTRSRPMPIASTPMREATQVVAQMVHRVIQERVQRQPDAMPASTPTRRDMPSERQATVQKDRRIEAVEPVTEPAQSLGQGPIPSVERTVVRTSQGQGRETAVTRDSALTSRLMVSSGTPAFTRQVVRTGEGPAQSERSIADRGQAVARAVVSQADGVSAQTSAISTGPDYGWLADTLWRRVQALKRYPIKAASARLEGHVVLVALVKANGEIAEIQVADSSGSPLLDEAAVEAVRNASPLILARPLAHAQVSVEVPISYHFE